MAYIDDQFLSDDNSKESHSISDSGYWPPWEIVLRESNGFASCEVWLDVERDIGKYLRENAITLREEIVNSNVALPADSKYLVKDVELENGHVHRQLISRIDSTFIQSECVLEREFMPFGNFFQKNIKIL